MLIPLHTITFGQSLVFIIKAHTLVVLALTYNILYHCITMRIGNRKSTIFLPPTHKFRKEATSFGPVTT